MSIEKWQTFQSIQWRVSINQKKWENFPKKKKKNLFPIHLASENYSSTNITSKSERETEIISFPFLNFSFSFFFQHRFTFACTFNQCVRANNSSFDNVDDEPDDGWMDGWMIILWLEVGPGKSKPKLKSARKKIKQTTKIFVPEQSGEYFDFFSVWPSSSSYYYFTNLLNFKIYTSMNTRAPMSLSFFTISYLLFGRPPTDTGTIVQCGSSSILPLLHTLTIDLKRSKVK